MQPTILVVDDDVNLLKMISTVLTQYKYQVLTAESGQSAMQVWKDHPNRIDLLFTDIFMHDMSGIELAGALMVLQPGLKVIFTSGADQERVEELFPYPENIRFLKKPVPIDVMVGCIKDACPSAAVHATLISPVSPAAAEARELIGELDAEIVTLYPGLPVNGIDAVEFEKAGGYFVIAREAGQVAGCGAFRPVDERCAEIKRMFVRSAARRQGIARKILRHLEEEIRRRGFRSMVLETGCKNTQAMALYEAEGYFPIPAYLGYVGSPISRCFVKRA
jgi:CheY-like chemotaxis protein